MLFLVVEALREVVEALGEVVEALWEVAEALREVVEALGEMVEALPEGPSCTLWVTERVSSGLREGEGREE